MMFQVSIGCYVTVTHTKKNIQLELHIVQKAIGSPTFNDYVFSCIFIMCNKYEERKEKKKHQTILFDKFLKQHLLILLLANYCRTLELYMMMYYYYDGKI